MMESGGQARSRTLVTAIAWIAGVILMLIAVLAIAAVFAPLSASPPDLGDAFPSGAGREGIPAGRIGQNQGIPKRKERER